MKVFKVRVFPGFTDVENGERAVVVSDSESAAVVGNLCVDKSGVRSLQIDRLFARLRFRRHVVCDLRELWQRQFDRHCLAFVELSLG